MFGMIYELLAFQEILQYSFSLRFVLSDSCTPIHVDFIGVSFTKQHKAIIYYVSYGLYHDTLSIRVEIVFRALKQDGSWPKVGMLAPCGHDQTRL